MPKPEPERLAALKQQAEQLKARISKIEARQAANARKEDTRLKVVVGAAVLADAKLNPATADFIRAVLVRAMTAQRDREFLQAKGWLLAGDSNGKVGTNRQDEAARKNGD